MKLHFASVFLLTAIILPLAMLGCSHSEVTTEPRFGIYLVETGELIISEQHIESYNSSVHEIELNEEGIERWNDFIAAHDPEDTTSSRFWCLHQKDFSVKLEDDEIYTGKFWSPASSVMCEGIVIMYFPELSDEYNTLWISYGYPFPPDDSDPRNDPRIIDFFAGEGLLKN